MKRKPPRIAGAKVVYKRAPLRDQKKKYEKYP
jgi:hypothetical protein